MINDENPDGLNLEGNPDQQEKELELEPKETDKESDGSDGDPLDKIEDLEELRGKAKNYRGAYKRVKEERDEFKKSSLLEEKKVEPEKVPTDYLKKSDFELANQKKAVHLATDVSETDSEETKAIKTDMLENWDEVRSFYVSRRGKDTPEDVLEDIKDAYTVFNSRRAKKEEKGVGELSKTKVIPGQSTPAAQKPKEKLPPNFSIPRPPSEWYPKKQ